MKCDIDTGYLVQTLKQNPGDMDVVNDCLNTWKTAGYTPHENVCLQIKQELSKLTDDSSFLRYWRSCSHIPTMVWIASALHVDKEIIYQATDESVKRWTQTRHRLSMASSFRSVLTFDHLVDGFMLVNGDDIWK